MKSPKCEAFISGDELALSFGMIRTFSSLQFWLTSRQSTPSDFSYLKGITSKLSQLMSPCAFGHGHMLKTRDEQGHLALECADCGQTTRVLDKPVFKGPKLHASPVKGAPSTTARRVRQERAYPRSA